MTNFLENEQRKNIENYIELQKQVVELEKIAGCSIETLKNMFLAGYEFKKDDTKKEQEKLELENMKHIPTIF